MPIEEIITSGRVPGVELRWTLKDLDEKKVKQKQLERTIQEAEAAGVQTDSLSRLKQALFDVQKRTADADLLFDQTTEMINSPGAWSSDIGYYDWRLSPHDRLVKKYRDSETGEMKEQLDPHGRATHPAGYTYSNTPYDKRPYPFKQNIQRWEPYRQSKTAAIEAREVLVSSILESQDYKHLEGITSGTLQKQRKFGGMITPENITAQLAIRKDLVNAYYGNTQDAIFSLSPRDAIMHADRLIDRKVNPRKVVVSSSATSSAPPSAPATEQSDADIAKRRKDTYNTVEKLRTKTQHALSTAQKLGLNSYVPALEQYLNDSLVIDTETGTQQFDIRAKFPDQAVAAVESEEYRRKKSADDQMLSQLERKIEPLEERVFVKRDMHDTGAMFMLKKVSGAKEMEEFLRRLG